MMHWTPPLIAKQSWNHSSVFDLSCEPGWSLNLKESLPNFPRTIDVHTIQFGNDTTYSPASLRIYCVENQWYIDNWNYNENANFNIHYNNKYLPLARLPKCDGNNLI